MMAKPSNMVSMAETIHLGLCMNCLEKQTHRTVTRYRFRLSKYNQKYFPALFFRVHSSWELNIPCLIARNQSETLNFQIYEIEIFLFLTHFKWMYFFSSTLAQNDPTCCFFALLWQATLSLTQWVCSCIHSQSKAQTSKNKPLVPTSTCQGSSCPGAAQQAVS